MVTTDKELIYLPIRTTKDTFTIGACGKFNEDKKVLISSNLDKSSHAIKKQTIINKRKSLPFGEVWRGFYDYIRPT